MGHLEKLINLRLARLKTIMWYSIVIAVITLVLYALLGFISDAYAVILICFINTFLGSMFFLALKNYKRMKSWIKWAKEYPNVAKKHFHIPLSHCPEQVIIRMAFVNGVIAVILLW